jgi:hypothetical protein
METISFDTNNEEDDEPSIDEVRAINEREIEIEWDADLSDAGDYKIVNRDDDDWNDDGVLDSFDDVDYDDNIVTIILDANDDPLDGDDTYELVVTSNVESIFGENSDVKGDDFAFAGNSTPYLGNPFTGVAYVNGTKLEVIDDDDFVSGDAFVSITVANISKESDAIAGGSKVYDATTTGYQGGFPTNDDDFYLVVADYTPFIDGVVYEVTVKPGEDRRLENGTSNIEIGTVTGTVELLDEFKTTSGTALDVADTNTVEFGLEIDNLEADSDFDYTLYLFDLSAANAVADASTLVSTESLTLDDAVAGSNGVTDITVEEEKLSYDFAKGSVTHAILVVKEGGNVRYVTDEIEFNHEYK